MKIADITHKGEFGTLHKGGGGKREGKKKMLATAVPKKTRRGKSIKESTKGVEIREKRKKKALPAETRVLFSEAQ